MSFSKAKPHSWILLMVGLLIVLIPFMQANCMQSSNKSTSENPSFSDGYKPTPL